MRLGVHVRIARGLQAAIATAKELGCEAVQLFAGNPNAWRESTLSPRTAEEFRADAAKAGLRPIILHTAYLLNLASPNELIHGRSVNALILAMQRAKLLGAEYVVTHIGSHGGSGYTTGTIRVQKAVLSALAASPGDHCLLLEGGAGAGNTIGSRFEEMAELLDLIGKSPRVGIALDTAHIWGVGYDISTPAAADRVIAEFDVIVGLSYLKLMHLNDTRMALGSHRDRHWHIGDGRIGLPGFGAIINHEAFHDIAGILETPMDEPGWDSRNINLLKSMRKV